MHPSLGSNYLLAAILLNPVLFLHSVNTILSRILPPMVVGTAVQPPYSSFGPSAEHPHLDVHVSENFCWSYTLVMVCAQLVAFGRVSSRRAKGRELKERRKEERRLALLGHESGPVVQTKLPNGYAHYNNENGNPAAHQRHDSEDTITETEDEIIL